MSTSEREKSFFQQGSVISRRSGQSVGGPTNKWDRVKDSIKLGTLRFVGLEPTAEEKRHWEAVQGTILTRKQAKSPSVQSFRGGIPQQPASSIRTSLTPRDAAAVRHITGRSIHRLAPPSEPRRVFSDGNDGMTSGGPPPPLDHSVSSPGPRGSTYNKGTGRNVTIKTELKPDLWKVAYNSVRTLTRGSKPSEGAISPRDQPKSFYGLDDSDDEDQTDAPFTPTMALHTLDEADDEDFFGDDEPTFYEDRPILSPIDETDSVPMSASGGPPMITRIEEDTSKLTPGLDMPWTKRRNRIGERFKEGLKTVTLSGGYDRGYGGLGLPTLLLRFDYKGLDPKDRKRLDQQILHKRPFFTYWLMTVQVIIMVIALAVYGFAPYSWDLVDVRDIVIQPDGGYDSRLKRVVGNVWGGPPQQALVVMGALYSPCMRRDSGLFAGIESDRQMENTSSGCCVRLDNGGCFQTLATDCSSRFNDFFLHSEDNETRAVCGTSPRTCLDPLPNRFIGSYEQGDVLTWLPICRESSNSSEAHLTCEVTARPCCFGVQALCTITTRENCAFLDGRFHQDAFLCSQVDCLNNICGLLPFREFNQPDQIYRLWLALFLHAGIIHLVFSLLFDFFVLRHVEKRLGWWRTAFVYVLSGVGGNMVSAYFVPYYPEVGPAGSILGIVAYFFVFLIFESPHLMSPWIEALKLSLLVLLPLLAVGLLPFIDNFAHIGGFVFGFLLSGIIVPYWAEKKAWEEIDKQNTSPKYLVLQKVKLAMIGIGIPLVPALFVLFILLFYLLQSTWIGFSYLNCVPFTSTFCIDNQALRDRSEIII